MSPYWIVLVGPPIHNHVLMAVENIDSALQAMWSLFETAPMLPTTLYYSSSAELHRVLTSDGQMWRVAR